MHHLRGHLLAVYERKAGMVEGEPDGAGDLQVPLEEFQHYTYLVRSAMAACADTGPVRGRQKMSAWLSKSGGGLHPASEGLCLAEGRACELFVALD